jgi:hypothetical protein
MLYGCFSFNFAQINWQWRMKYADRARDLDIDSAARPIVARHLFNKTGHAKRVEKSLLQE